ncbi:uncharacterized protein PGTG_10322 [Puccinia graminis f. sp. tritici CRL 75-36-700-3]|uniref:Uncharacterized protein n=1 Tax=Puccinia graminis f. sp. tritici (strain CRL 75-36-700-3 / race SCCL) TaxID=418459 RepID=E3KKM6_PUCGT|nr:uncharacterized protein PGTG_10322 [Puccinia graminis f. sp. tritici CRL 75-36-700-3]EFP84851.1 hypothetical protein PGTG_10322 [Puccinia graminis f. sp. tritici CRL 75-36-700-3]
MSTRAPQTKGNFMVIRHQCPGSRQAEMHGAQSLRPGPSILERAATSRTPSRRALYRRSLYLTWGKPIRVDRRRLSALPPPTRAAKRFLESGLEYLYRLNNDEAGVTATGKLIGTQKYLYQWIFLVQFCRPQSHVPPPIWSGLARCIKPSAVIRRWWPCSNVGEHRFGSTSSLSFYIAKVLL